MTTIEVWRSGWVVKHDGVSGEIAEVWVGDTLLCWAVERLEGFVRLDLGAYTIKMEFSPTIKVKVAEDTYVPRKQFRVYGHHKQGGNAAILIHAANFPGELKGCIGPGLVATEEGVDHSEKAMQKLFQLFGGFKAGAEGGLKITQG